MNNVPYIKLNRMKESAVEINVDFIITHNNTPIVLSVLDDNKKVEKLFRLGFKNADNLNLLDRNNVFSNIRLNSKDQDIQYRIIKQDSNLSHGMMFNLIQSDYLIDWEGEGLVSILTRHLKEKEFLPVSSKIVQSVIDFAGEHMLVKECSVITTQEDRKGVRAWYIGDAKAFKYFLHEISFSRKTDFDWSKVNDVTDYLLNFSEAVKNELEDNIEILYDKDNLSPNINNFIKPYKGQLAIIQGGIESLKQKNNRFLYLAAEQGVGKTICGTKINHLYHEELGKDSYCTLLVVPAITLTQWKEEIVKTIGNHADVRVIETTSDFIRFYDQTNMEVDKPTYLIVGKETFKLSYQMESSVLSRQRIIDGKKEEVCLCPDCFYPQENTVGNSKEKFFRIEEYNRMKNRSYKCQNCDTILFQSVYNKTKKTSIIDFVKRRGIRFDSVIVDEAHESNNFDSIIGQATRNIIQRAKKTILLSGTVTNGYASSIYNILFALIPNTLRKNGVFEKDRFIEAYGTRRSITNYDPTRGDRVNRSTFREIEGINPLVFSKYFINNFIFAELDEIRDDLPPLIENYVEIDQLDEIKTNEELLLEDIKNANPLNYVFYKDSVVKHFINNPFNWNEIPFTFKEELDKPDVLVKPKNISKTMLPKERKLLNICTSEKEEGRKTWVYTDFVTTGSYSEGENLQDRLQRVLEDGGLRVFVLKSSTSPIQRRGILERNKDKFDVFISHPKLISVGVNLQWCPNYVFYSPSYHVNTTRQASKRGRRVNSTLENRIYHLYYNSGVELEIMDRYKLKRAESEAIEATYSEGTQTTERTASNLGAQIERQLSDN